LEFTDYPEVLLISPVSVHYETTPDSMWLVFISLATETTSQHKTALRSLQLENAAQVPCPSSHLAWLSLIFSFREFTFPGSGIDGRHTIFFPA
jgi:hypothetical protein